jgi:hypothetical protein
MRFAFRQYYASTLYTGPPASVVGVARSTYSDKQID